jgi:CHASE2 domain-containing sensor protein
VSGRRALAVLVALALVCDVGIVGMLLSDDGWDWLFLAMAALPLAFGVWSWRARRRDAAA